MRERQRVAERQSEKSGQERYGAGGESQREIERGVGKREMERMESRRETRSGWRVTAESAEELRRDVLVASLSLA